LNPEFHSGFKLSSAVTVSFTSKAAVMEIVPLSSCPQHVPILAHWAFIHWYINRNIRFEIVESDYRRRADFSSLPVCWVAVHLGMPIGMVSLKEYDLQSHRHLTPWLSALFVVPQYRNKGIGEKLINEVVSYATKSNTNALHLFTDHRNSEYLSQYYHSRGWELLEKTLDNDGMYTEILKKNIC